MAGRKPTILVAQRSFWVGKILVRAGDTVVVGHPLTVGRERNFRPFVPTFQLPRQPKAAATGAERAVRQAETR